MKCVVGQAGNFFILAQNVGFALVLSKRSDGASKMPKVMQDNWETGQSNGTRPKLSAATFCVLPSVEGKKTNL